MLLEVLKKIRFKLLVLHFQIRKLYWKIFHSNEEFKVKPLYELKNEEIEDSDRNDLVEGPAADMSKSGVIYKIIDKVKQNKLTELDISGLRLRDMPPIVSQCVSVETIILSENELDSTCLPMLTPLINMKYCYLSKNRINSIPISNYGRMMNLRLLDLDFNGLTNGFEHDTIEKIKLHKLYISNNNMREFPEVVCKITTLTTLYGNNNKIINLPIELSHLVNLKQLSLANNMINEIPPEIKMLVNLEQLNLMRNKLREIPSEIGFLMKLKELLLGNNHIEKIPNQLEKNISVSKFYSPKLKKGIPSNTSLNHTLRSSVGNY